MALYFVNHFCFGCEINGIDVSLKSMYKVKTQMISELQSYKLNLKERGGNNEEIRGSEIHLKYTPEEAFDNFKDKQNPYKWAWAIFNAQDYKMTIGVSYDEKLLKEKVDKLSCFDSSKIIEPENPGFKYTDKGYVIVDEVNGNKVDKDRLYEYVVDAIAQNHKELDLESMGCYIKPQYTSKSPKVMETLGMLNKYVSSKVTYTFEKGRAILDGSVINNCLTVNENLDVTLDEKKLEGYINALSNSYAETGKIRNFTTSSGKTITIDGGDYTYMINAAKEAQYLSGIIKEGKTVTKEPAYIQKNAYVEIDLTKQHLWFYKSGTLITQGDIVSGDVNINRGTPEGVYKLKYKKRNAVLRGPGYAAPVNYWMPFNGGIGIHDATWRHKFGGNIYKGDGSHGCINCPYSLAKTIYENIDAGTPVICYY